MTVGDFDGDGIADLDRSRRCLDVRRLELALQDLNCRASDRLLLGHAADLLGGGVPEDDLAVSVDRHDAVGDVRKDRNAAFLFQ